MRRRLRVTPKAREEHAMSDQNIIAYLRKITNCNPFGRLATA
ncbi:MAG: hypothetical protein NWE78_00185 [Candidatus Bathyarchaeota archaeon]|nr:hypothetical protein [Candidatus Bathyarchaeota archaeon]